MPVRRDGDCKCDSTETSIEAVAATPANVLVLGESGVSKEMIARAIHANSDRAGKPLVKINCASIPKELFESEFFGYVKGAFTGAHRDRIELGGCVITPGQPQWICRKCDHRWSGPTELQTPSPSEGL